MITNLNSDFTLKNGLLGGDKLAKSADWDKYIFSGYGIEFDSHSEISLLDGSVGKNVIIFGVDMSSSVHIDNNKKDTLIVGIGPKKRLDNITLTAKVH